MKKLILIFVFSLLTVFVKGQIVVSNPTLEISTIENWRKQLTEINKQYNELSEQTKLMKQNLDAVSKVSEFIKSSESTKQLISNQISYISYIGKELKNLSSLKFSNPQRLVAYKNDLQASVKSLNETIKLTKQILTDNAIKMTDYERAKEIENISLKSELIMQNIKMRKKYHVKKDRLEKGLKHIMNK